MKLTPCLPSYCTFGCRTKMKCLPKGGNLRHLWGRVCADCQVIWLIDYEARGCYSNHPISCPLRARPSTNLDSFLLQAAHAPVLLNAYLHLQASKCHKIRCHSCSHISWQLLSCKYNWQPEVSLPIPSFPKLKPTTFRRTEIFFITSSLRHHYPSEFLLHHLWKLTALIPLPRPLTKQGQGHLVCDVLDSFFILSPFLGMKTPLFHGNDSHFCLHGV